MQKTQVRSLDWEDLPGLRRSPGEENGYPLQYSCLKNPTDWRATVLRVAKRRHDWATSTHTETLMQSEVSQKDKNKYEHRYIGNLEKWSCWNYLQGRSTDADVKNGVVDGGVGEGESGTNWETSTDIYTCHVSNSQLEGSCWSQKQANKKY